MEQVTRTTPDLLAKWEDWMAFKGLSPNTIRLYSRVVDHAVGELDLLEATTEDLDAWVQARGGKAGTVANRISALVNFYRFLVKTKHKESNPATEIDRPRQTKGVPKPVKDLESKLSGLDALDVLRERPIGESRAMATFLAETGLRIHEAVALQEEVPCPETIMVMGKGHKEALLLLTPEAREALDFLKGRWPIGARATQRRFEKVGMHPHQLRHHLGCTLAASGADLGEIQDLLRHSSPATSKTYAAYSTERLRAAQARRVGVTL